MIETGKFIVSVFRSLWRSWKTRFVLNNPDWHLQLVPGQKMANWIIHTIDFTVAMTNYTGQMVIVKSKLGSKKYTLVRGTGNEQSIGMIKLTLRRVVFFKLHTPIIDLQARSTNVMNKWIYRYCMKSFLCSQIIKCNRKCSFNGLLKITLNFSRKILIINMRYNLAIERAWLRWYANVLLRILTIDHDAFTPCDFKLTCTSPCVCLHAVAKN